MDIISDSDIDQDDDSSSEDGKESNEQNEQKFELKENTEDNKDQAGIHSKGKPSKINAKDLKNVTIPTPQFTTAPSEVKEKPLPVASFRVVKKYQNSAPDAPDRSNAYYRYIEKPSEDLEEKVCRLL